MEKEEALRKIESLRKIDCHTHIINEKIRSEYFGRVKNRYALVMEFPGFLMKSGLEHECSQTVRGDDRLFICPYIDLRSDIGARLSELEPRLESDKIVGLKVYLSYQKGRADEEKLFPAYEFAAKHRLSFTFHTGLCSLVLPSDNDLEGSSAVHIGRAAELYPEVNFIAAHMDDPEFDRCMDVVASHKNIYTDISGAYETGTSYGANIDAAIDLFKSATDKHPECFRQMLYGTDFCPPISLGQLDEYDYSLYRMFPSETWEDICWGNALRAFPRLGDYLK